MSPFDPKQLLPGKPFLELPLPRGVRRSSSYIMASIPGEQPAELDVEVENAIDQARERLLGLGAPPNLVEKAIGFSEGWARSIAEPILQQDPQRGIIVFKSLLEQSLKNYAPRWIEGVRRSLLE